MQFTDFRQLATTRRDLSTDRFSDWSEAIDQMIESIILREDFEKVLRIVFNFDHHPISRLTDDEREEQLETCSQIKGIFITLRDRLELYLAKVQRARREWQASLYIKSEAEVYAKKDAWVKAGTITRSNVSVTKDDIQNQFLVTYGREHEEWLSYEDKIETSKRLMESVVEDIESRSMILMSLRKRSRE